MLRAERKIDKLLATRNGLHFGSVIWNSMSKPTVQIGTINGRTADLVNLLNQQKPLHGYKK